MAGDKSSRTEDPTSKRIKDARQEGRIARSNDLVSWSAVLIGLTAIQATFSSSTSLLTRMFEQMKGLIAQPDANKSLEFMVTSIRDAFASMIMLILAFTAISLVGHLAQVRFVLARKAIKPDLKKLNPIPGFKRMFSAKQWFEAGKQAAKAIAIGFVAYNTLYNTVLSLVFGGPYAIGEVMRIVGSATISFIRTVAILGVIIGIVDYFYQRRSIRQGLKMTKQEVKEEHRQQDIAPEIKGKIKQKQFQMSRNRMMAAVGDADVVVVNPIHVAVALKYDPTRGAPRVVAKGAGFVAEKIKQLAEEHSVPLVQDVPLARTLHRICDLDDEIPGDLFEAVAKLLAFVFSLRSRGTGSGFHKMPGTPDWEQVETLDHKTMHNLVSSGKLPS